MKQVGYAGSNRYSGGVLFCHNSGLCLDGDGACGGEREQGVLVNIARITRSCSNRPNTSTPPNPEYPL